MHLATMYVNFDFTCIYSCSHSDKDKAGAYLKQDYMNVVQRWVNGILYLGVSQTRHRTCDYKCE